MTNKRLKFTKMHGLGNDFIIIDAINQHISLDSQQIVQWSDRHYGIGFDQCLIIEKPIKENTDFFYRIFNANGSEVGQCLNGVRCLARYAYEYGLTNQKEITVATATTRMSLKLNQDGTVTVNLEPPLWHPQDIPLTMPIADSYALKINNQTINIYSVNVGNPHAVMVVKNIESAPVKEIGKTISEHLIFPEGCNAGFMQIVSPGLIKLRVYERGAAETLACGSGAAASGVIARRFFNAAEQICIQLPGGDLNVSWDGNEKSPIFLTGPAAFVFDGEIMV